MSNRPHSADYFGDTRDLWWNRDFLELMGKRLRMGEARDVLDVGCGVGHWGRTVLPLLHPQARVLGVDPEAEWVTKATATAAQLGETERLAYQRASVQSLPFEDERFDLVTCQTVLIHVPDVTAALHEMLRVLKPGGLLLTAEPDNLASSAMQDTATFVAPIDDVMDELRFELVCFRGRAALGEGHLAAGSQLPRLFADLGLESIQLYQNDKANPLFPPYTLPSQKTEIAELESFVERGLVRWLEADSRRYWIAGGGDPAQVDRLWSLVMTRRRHVLDELRAGRYGNSGASAHYLVSGRKPAKAR